MSWASSFKSMMFHVSWKNKSETKVILNARNCLMFLSLNMTKEFKPIPWLKRLQVEKHLLCSQVKQFNVVSLLRRSWEQILWHVATRVRVAWSRYEGVRAICLDPVSTPSVHLWVAQSHVTPLKSSYGVLTCSSWNRVNQMLIDLNLFFSISWDFWQLVIS